MNEKMLNDLIRYCLDWLSSPDGAGIPETVQTRLKILQEQLDFEEQSLLTELNVESLDDIDDEQEMIEVVERQKLISIATLLKLSDAIDEFKKEFNDLNIDKLDASIHQLKALQVSLAEMRQAYQQLQIQHSDINTELQEIIQQLSQYEQYDETGSIIVDHNDPREIWRSRKAALEYAEQLKDLI